jgi:hypothetical protein
MEGFFVGESRFCGAAGENLASLRLAGRAKAPVPTRAHYIEDRDCPLVELRFPAKSQELTAKSFRHGLQTRFQLQAARGPRARD